MGIERSRLTNRQRTPLTRGADGRLKPATGEADIADVWAQQRRIGLNQAINDERARAALKKLRHERGLVGLAKLYIHNFVYWVRKQFFGTTALQQTKPANTSAKIIRVLRDKSVRLFATIHRTPRAVTATFLVLVLTGLGYALLRPDTNDPTPTSEAAVQGTSTANKTALQKGTPDYDTVIPAGKSIESLGGWTRVSPPETDAVYAYVDAINSIPISVSQQPLPASFQRDASSNVAKLAKDYSATQQLKVDGMTVYIGTSAKGPQSLIFTQNDLLILIKSTAPVADDMWINYIKSLR